MLSIWILIFCSIIVEAGPVGDKDHTNFRSLCVNFLLSKTNTGRPLPDRVTRPVTHIETLQKSENILRDVTGLTTIKVTRYFVEPLSLAPPAPSSGGLNPSSPKVNLYLFDLGYNSIQTAAILSIWPEELTQVNEGQTLKKMWRYKDATKSVNQEFHEALFLQNDVYTYVREESSQPIHENVPPKIRRTVRTFPQTTRFGATLNWYVVEDQELSAAGMWIPVLDRTRVFGDENSIPRGLAIFEGHLEFPSYIQERSEVPGEKITRLMRALRPSETQMSADEVKVQMTPQLIDSNPSIVIRMEGTPTGFTLRPPYSDFTIPTEDIAHLTEGYERTYQVKSLFESRSSTTKRIRIHKACLILEASDSDLLGQGGNRRLIIKIPFNGTLSNNFSWVSIAEQLHSPVSGWYQNPSNFSIYGSDFPESAKEAETLPFDPGI